MTTIIGMKTETGVLLIADRRAMDGSRCGVLSEPKVFASGAALIGFSGTLRSLQALKSGLNLRDRQPGETPLQYLTGVLVTEIRLALHDRMVTEETPSEMIVACGGELFVVTSDGSVLAPHRGYDAIGSGQDYALGAMYVIRHLTDARLRLWKAMEAAAEFDGYTGAPFEYFELAAPEKENAR